MVRKLIPATSSMTPFLPAKGSYGIARRLRRGGPHPGLAAEADDQGFACD